MPAGSFTTHRGERVLVADYAGRRDTERRLAAMMGVQALIEAEPPGSVRYLLDVTGMRFDSAVLTRLRELGERSRPFFRASAVVGVAGLQLAVYRILVRALHLEMPAFATRAEALDWLTAPER